MRRALPYIIGAVVLALLVYIAVNASSGKRVRRLDERVTFRRYDKIPYGTYVAYQSVGRFFPYSKVTVNSQEPGAWDSLETYEPGQALMIIAPVFNASDDEMKQLLAFASNGNQVFISTAQPSEACMELLKCSTGQEYFTMFSEGILALRLASPPYGKTGTWRYPGKTYDNHFTELDSGIARILGYNGAGQPNFIRLRTGTGNVFLHLAPMAFSNYFLMHRENLDYFESVLSLLPEGLDMIAWDEYYLRKRPDTQNNRSNWLASLFKERSTGSGLIVLLVLLLVYVLLEMRRKQRPIPVITRPVNDSLDFVKTIGRLYHDKRDHKDLARKMSIYFLEHVRTRYQLATNRLNEDFVRSLHFKSGFETGRLQELASFINFLDSVDNVTEAQLHDFYKQLENFYKST